MEIAPLTAEQKQLIENNWQDIKSYTNYLWDRQFRVLYEKVRLEKEDFAGLSYQVICECAKTYSQSKSAFPTFVKNAVERKAKTLVTEMNREKRMGYTYAKSLNEPVIYKGEDIEFGDTIPAGEKSEDTGNLVGICSYLSKLSVTQIKILLLIELGFNKSDIKTGLKLSNKELNDAFKCMQNFNKTILLKGVN